MTISLTGIYYYPVKSCAGTTLDAAEIGRRGILHDREWLIVNTSNRFISQREIPAMCLVSPTIRQTAKSPTLILKAPLKPSIEVPNASDGPEHQVSIWNDTCLAVDQGDEAADWLSDFLGEPVRLVRMAEEHRRQVDQKFAHRSSDEVGFADGFPLLLISEGSLEDLNSRLDSPVPMNRFRPNLVITGCAAFAEDTWQTFRVGKVVFDVVKPCARCTITTIDQSTGKRGSEPLKTLSGYRNSLNRVLFGQNIVHQSTGTIRVGDEVEVVEQGNGSGRATVSPASNFT